MKPNLLNDILHEDAYAICREEILHQIQIEARRKRFARAARWMALAACLTIAFVLSKAPAPKQSAPITVTSAAVENPIFLKTAALKPSQILETHPIPNLVMTTDPTRKTSPISDSELLALFPKKPVGLASTLAGVRRLLFLNPADERRFMSSN